MQFTSTARTRHARRAILLGLVVGSTLAASAQVITGGYAPADVKSAAVRAAANFAVTTQARRERQVLKLKAIKAAESQVVAGTNYKVCLAVAEGKKTETAEAVVYVDLKGRRSLTSWREAECGG